MKPVDLSDWLYAETRVLDGAMGSELLRRGIASARHLWGVGALLDAPGKVREVHRSYALAGAEAATAATFRVAPYSLRKVGLESRAGELAGLAVRLARDGARAAGRETLVLASQTTLEDCYRPDLVPDDATLAREHALTAALHAGAGADAILIETLNTIREASVAATAAAATGLPVLVCFACASSGTILSGEDAGAAADAVSAIPGVVAVGVNCTSTVHVMPALVRMAEATDFPLVAYGNNAWFAEDSPWLNADPAPPERYACTAHAWVAAGARLVGAAAARLPSTLLRLPSSWDHAGGRMPT